MAKPTVYVLKSNGAVQPQAGSEQPVGANLSTGLQNTTTNPQLGLLESIDKSVKESVKGTEAWHGSGGLGSTGALGTVGVVAGVVAKFDDVTTVGNNLLAGKFLETSMEAAGAFAGPVGGGAGAWAASKTIGLLPDVVANIPAIRPLAVGASIYFGDKYAGDQTKEFVYGEWVQATAPVIPADAALQAAHTINGTKYYVVSAPDGNGAPRTYIYTDSPNVTGSDPLLFPNQLRYMPVVNQDISKQVVAQVLTDLEFDPNITRQQWNVMNGLSPSGYPIGTAHFESNGNVVTVGTDSNAYTRQSTVQVSTFKDPATGAIMEVRLSGQLVNGIFEAGNAASFAMGMNSSGKTVFPQDANAPINTPSPIGIGQGNNKSLDDFRRSEIESQNNTAPNDMPFGTGQKTAPNSTQTWEKSPQSGEVQRITDVKNNNGSVTRIVEELDRTTGKVIAEKTFENTRGANPNNPDSFNLVGTFDPQSGTRFSVNRDTGQMEQVTGSASSSPTPRPASSTFITPVDPIHVTLSPGGTVSDIVLLQNRAGNPITADDIRAANPELNINDKYSNVRPGTSLLIPTRVGDKLITTSEPAEFKPDLTQEQADNLLTDLGLKPIGTNPVYSKANDILLADAGTTTGQPVVSDAGGGGSGGSETPASNQPETPAEPAQEAPETIAKAEPATDAATKDTQSLDEIKAYDQAFAAGNSFSNMVHNWAHMDDAQRITGLIGLYNQIDTLPLASSTNPNAPNATSNPDGNLPGNVTPALNWLNVANSLNSLSQWDKMGDVAHLTATLSLYTQLSSVSTGGLAGAANVGTTLSYISLAQSIDKGDAAGIISSLNTFNDHVIDGAINSALGTSGVPYIGIAMALNDFEHHPGQSIGALVGMYFGPIGSMLGSMIGSLLDEAFGPGKPPPPEGTVHYSWDANGTIQVHIDSDTSGGGAIALKTAHSLQGLLQNMVQAINDHNPDPADNVALNPYLLPQVGFSQGHAWLHGQLPDGTPYTQNIDSPDLAEQLLRTLTQSGAIAPAWQVQTQQGHLQQLLAQGADQGVIAAQLGSQASALQGHATENADQTRQSFGVVVIALQESEAVREAVQETQQQVVQLSQVYKNTDTDAYAEHTQWISAQDSRGQLQGMLVLDQDGNGVVDTADLLNLGGNGTDHAQQQHNNLQWLDANGDGLLDAHDPAFAAIKLWVDLNQDGQLQSGESASLASLQMVGLDLANGQVLYADGHHGQFAATTLESDTEGLRLTQVQQADAQGVLHSLDAGQMLEHEGYVDGVRHASFEHDALRVGDWEGSAEQDAHRHGGSNVASAPTQTQATGAVSLGPVKRVVFVPMVQRAQSAVSDGAQADFGGLGLLALAGLGATQTFVAQAQPVGSAERVQALEPLVADGPAVWGRKQLGVQEERTVSSVVEHMPIVHLDDMARSEPVQSVGRKSAHGAEPSSVPPVWLGPDVVQAPLPQMRATLVSAGLLGRAAAAQEEHPAAAPLPLNGDTLALALPVVQGETLAGTEDTVIHVDADLLLANDSSASASANAQLPSLHISAVGSPSHGQVSLQSYTNGLGQPVTEVVFVPDPDFFGTASFSYTVTDQYGLSQMGVATLLVQNVNDAPFAQGEVVSGASEDAVFVIAPSVLFANDGDVDDAPAALSIGWVGNAQHGSVALDANGNVVFTPGLNFNGNAAFEYAVRDAAGLLSPAVQVVVPVAAVNDAPLAVDDAFTTYVNSTMTIGLSQLTSNDSDVENDPLSVQGVGNASHGQVAMVNGQVQFVPTPGFVGQASFDYLLDDGQGGQTWGTALVEVMPPPNLYASMQLWGTNFYGTQQNAGVKIDIASASFSVSDDGNAAAATVSLLNVSVHRTDLSDVLNPNFDPTPQWLGLDGVNGFSWNASSMYLDVKRPYGFDAFESTWLITDDLGLTNVWHFNYSMQSGASSYMEHTGYAGPVVLALGDGAPGYLSTTYSKVHFDVNLDGVADTLAWAAPGSGVLGLDLNGDQQISSAAEFAFKQYKDGAQTDLEGLQAFDTNHNQQLDAGDAQWAQFGVWEDKNADGQTQAGEYRTLDALGIASIALQSNAQVHTPALGSDTGDVVVMGDATFTRTDGSTGAVADAMFSYQDGHDAQQAAAARSALLFNQWVNTASSHEADPLGFVPVQAESWVPELLHSAHTSDAHTRDTTFSQTA